MRMEVNEIADSVVAKLKLSEDQMTGIALLARITFEPLAGSRGVGELGDAPLGQDLGLPVLMSSAPPGLRFPSGSLEMAAGWTTASKPSRSSGPTSRMS
jgi:hypothetical protein